MHSDGRVIVINIHNIINTKRPPEFGGLFLFLKFNIDRKKELNKNKTMREVTFSFNNNNNNNRPPPMASVTIVKRPAIFSGSFFFKSTITRD